MKRKFRILFTLIPLFLIAFVMMAAMPDDEPMTRLDDGTYVIDTTGLCSDITGYRDATPIKVYIQKDQVVKIEYLPNQESPRYFRLLRDEFKEKWNGLKVKQALELEPDGYTGATYSAIAITENVRTALQYYKTHKK